MKLERKTILNTLKANKKMIQKFEVKSLALFGSCARGENSQFSDLDFLVEFKKKSFDSYMDLREFLEKLFQCPVDLVLKNTLKPRLRKTILKEALHATGF